MGTITRTLASETRETARLAKRCRAAICYSEVQRLFPNKNDGQREQLIFNRSWSHNADGKAVLNNTVRRWAMGICAPSLPTIAKIELAAARLAGGNTEDGRLREWALSPFWDLFGPCTPAKEWRRTNYLKASIKTREETKLNESCRFLHVDIMTWEQLLRAGNWRSIVTCLLLSREAERLNQMLIASLAYNCAYFQLDSVLSTNMSIAEHAEDFLSLVNLLAPAPFDSYAGRQTIPFRPHIDNTRQLPAEFSALATLIMTRARHRHEAEERRDSRTSASSSDYRGGTEELHGLVAYVLAHILTI